MDNVENFDVNRVEHKNNADVEVRYTRQKAERERS